jgi:tRNA(fMet)-specific endonuclease VapC
MIVLDTDVLIEILDKRSGKGEKVLDRIRESGENTCITSITLHEILYGLEKYAKPVNEVMQLPVLPYTKKDSSLSARIELSQRGEACRCAGLMP